ncbi:MAG: DUF3426 domain-containing protein [bacterium]|nr:DUF3426 domain-containing protein [bacterium]
MEQPADLPPLGEPPPFPPEAGAEPGARPAPGSPPGGLGAGRPAHERDRTVAPQPPPAQEPGLPDLGGLELEGTMRESDESGLPASPEADDGGLPDLSGLSEGGGEWGNISLGEEPAPETGGDGFGLAAPPAYVPPPPAPVEDDQDFMAPPSSYPAGPSTTSTAPAYEPEAAPSKKGRKGLVLLLLLGILGGAGYFYYPDIMEYVKPGARQAEGTLTPANVQVKSLNRADGKVIYTVRGEVKNESAGTVGMVQVEAQFRNAADDILSRSGSFCGNVIKDGALVNADMGKVRADLNNELGQSLNNSSIPPGSSVPFLIVLENPPAGVSKVTVTISGFQETT